MTALQTLEAVRVGDGDTVLVHAAAGGVGHFAVQLARQLGASRVIGTASERNHGFLRELGAEPVTYGEGLVSRVADLVGDWRIPDRLQHFCRTDDRHERLRLQDGYGDRHL